MAQSVHHLAESYNLKDIVLPKKIKARKKAIMKKSTTTYITLLFCFLTLQAYSQNIASISGKVINKANEPNFGNVVVLSAIDTTFIKGTSFEDTTFFLTNINTPSVLLKFSALSFADTIIKVVYKGQSHIDMGTVMMRLNEKELAAVTVVSKVPLVNHTANGTIEVNVAKTMLSASSSVTEILSKSPNVIENNGQISVFGKGEALIFLNGRLITNERLSSIPVSQILKIEIIPNPSSIYDAEGKAVINIITKTRGAEGIMGVVSQQITYSDFAGINAQSFFDLSYVKDKLSVIGNYSLLFGKSREFLHTIRTRPAADEYLKSDLTTDWRRQMNNYSNYGLGVQYNFDSKNNISISYNGSSEDMGGYTKSQNTILTKTDNSFYTSNIDKDELRTNNSVTLNYNRTVDSLGSTLFLGTQYSHFNLGIDDFITENRTVNSIDGSRHLKNDMDNGISVSSSQLDLTKILRGGQKLEMGTKFSYVTTKSATNFHIAENGNDYIFDKNLSNQFQYTEKIPAAYLSYSGVINKINYGIGVRGELTDYKLNTSVGGGQALLDTYFNIFPNFQLNTVIAKTFKLRASYTSRITRPRYQALNPYVIYQDPFTTVEGNPNLIPEKVHAFEIGANYHDYDFRMGYNYTIDPINGAALRGENPNSYVLKAINLEKGHSYFASLTKTINLKWWTSVTTFNLNYTNLIDKKYDFDIIKPEPQLYIYSSNTFNVKDIVKIQLLAWYLGRKKQGIYDEFNRNSVMLGIEKDFFKNKLKIRLLANDIFKRTYAWGTYGVGKTDIYYNRTFNNAYFRFIATWNFGKIKNSNFKIKSTGQSENSRAN
ncbi:MAG: TonB-dependent receptor [Saprospiraceae bacterium]|nr:TonB-dependent receptor [Saprospiraceae bacterium]